MSGCLHRGGQLILLRHGRTSWNAAGRFQGQADPPLDREGVTQARQAADELGLYRPQAIVSSDLRRAHQTGRCLADRWGIQLRLDSSLREQSLGLWEGLDHTEVAERYPAEYHSWLEDPTIRRGGGETEQEAGARASGSLIREIRACPPAQSVVVVSHGIVLRAALTRLLGRELVDFDQPVTHLDNGRWVVLPIRTAS